jgi:predicted dehydrogenase
MPKTYRVGVACLVHDHVWGDLSHWKAQPNATLITAGDIHPELCERAKGEFGLATTYGSWQAMLQTEGDNLDIVHVAAPNSDHADIVEACAARGIHVVLEKPMAATLSQAQRMIEAARAAETTLMINWPSAWSPAFQELERRLLAGAIGDVRYFKYRSAHNGPREIGCSPYFVDWLYDASKNGAGAFMDYCGYGAVMCARFLGRPDKVTGLRAVLAKDYPIADDNAIIAMQFPHAFGVAEASWTQPTGYIAPNPIAYGSDGALAIQGGNLILLSPSGASETIPAPPTESPRRNPAEYLLWSLESGQPIEGICSASVSLIAQEILEAGLRSADSGMAQVLAG